MQRVFTQDWLNSFWIAVARYVLPFTLHDIDCLCTWRKTRSSINVNKSLAVFLLLVYSFYPLFYTAILSSAYFIPTLSLYFCLFRDHVNKPITLVFWPFVYHLKNVQVFQNVFKSKGLKMACKLIFITFIINCVKLRKFWYLLRKCSSKNYFCHSRAGQPTPQAFNVTLQCFFQIKIKN